MNKQVIDLEFMAEVHQVAVDHGWWEEGKHKTDLECICLMHAELSEAAEEVRKNADPIYFNLDEDNPEPWKPEGEAVELADVVLRMLDYCHKKKLPLLEAIALKHAYNKTREYRHGGKKF